MFGIGEVEHVVKEVERVIRAGVGFRVVLASDDVEFGAFEAFGGFVVHVLLSDRE